MQTETEKEISVILRLTVREATWLKAYVQNSKEDNEAQGGNEEDSKMREIFFLGLRAALEKENLSR